jgi:flavin reductase (DIM6/NTAB) family NADH-FMN oxidoreductase RutF
MGGGVQAIQDAFRAAMRSVASTVTIVSAQSGAERHGTTATSVTSISMEPPSLLVCLNRASRLHDFLGREGRFCVNVLHTDNLETARIFSNPAVGPERFNSGDWRTDADGMLSLANAQAIVFCRKEKEVVYGSHTIFIGRVLKAQTRDDISPLLYQDGRYTASRILRMAPEGTPIK